MTTPLPDAATLDSFEREMDALRDETLAKVGQRDANYIRNVVRFQRIADVSGRVLMIAGFYHWSLWIVGTLLLGLAKILDNMEIGHNVMHGQYDWMNDPHINSRDFEWDNVCDGQSWRRTHNYEHHTYTNIIGKDRDFGYDLLRLSDDTRWRKRYRHQFWMYVMLSVFFQWGVAYHELIGERVFFGRKKEKSELPISRAQLAKDFFSKINKSTFRDYLFYPLIGGLVAGIPVFFAVLAGHIIANLIRNLWTSSIIFCGHFTEDVHTFSEADCENESRGQWYYRQLLGSSNLQGNRWFHILTGHLSCQIEHHMFPDIPAFRYVEMSERVRDVCQRHGIHYNTGSFFKQYTTVVQRIIKYSKPTPAELKTA